MPQKNTVAMPPVVKQGSKVTPGNNRYIGYETDRQTNGQAARSIIAGYYNRQPPAVLMSAHTAPGPLLLTDDKQLELC